MIVKVMQVMAFLVRRLSVRLMLLLWMLMLMRMVMRIVLVVKEQLLLMLLLLLVLQQVQVPFIESSLIVGEQEMQLQLFIHIQGIRFHNSH
jgi:hypothetical protein